MWLDVLLLVPAIYGAYLLRQQGSIAVLGLGISRNPFENPLLFLVPTLAALSLTLFCLRALPVIMSGLAWILSRTNSVSLLMAARHLARSPGYYSIPLALLVLTLSLSAFTATLARVLDTNLHERVYYKTGADMVFSELGELRPTNPSEVDFGEDVTSGSQWVFFPPEEYLEVPGVEAVARVGRYSAVPRLSTGGSQGGTFLGVDRYYFPQIAFWRQDFAPTSLGAMMNELALAPDGVLVDRNFMRRNVLNIGDTIGLAVDTVGQSTDLNLKIVGVFNLFPTWYPQDGPLFVGNLYYLFDHAGGEFPYQVWLKTEPNQDQQQLGNERLPANNVKVLDLESSRLIVDQELQRPERQGLFGVLSIGFAAAAFLTVLGFLLYAYYSYRRRFIELGVYRAIGFSTVQMTAYLAWELFFLILTGGAIGTGLGVLVSVLFIPYLQIGETAVDHFPPFHVWIDWASIFQIYGLFVLLFVITLGILVTLLRRMKIFQAIKLGETV
jgi:putative ABC transport system permease protein